MRYPNSITHLEEFHELLPSVSGLWVGSDHCICQPEFGCICIIAIYSRHPCQRTLLIGTTLGVRLSVPLVPNEGANPHIFQRHCMQCDDLPMQEQLFGRYLGRQISNYSSYALILLKYIVTYVITTLAQYHDKS